MIDEPIDEYLWDRTGEPDPELSELEGLLSRYRHSGPLPTEQREVDVTGEPDA